MGQDVGMMKVRAEGKRLHRWRAERIVSALERLQIEYVPVKRLRRWDKNPRVMSPSQSEALRAELKAYGFRDPLVVDQNYRVCGGHQRLDAAVALGLKEVPVVRSRMTEEQFKVLNLALNRIHGDWDAEKLAPLLDELRNLPEIALTGFSAQEIEKLIQQVMPAEATGREDDVPEEPAEAVTQHGDVWQLGKHRLLCGDATRPESWERLLEGSKIALYVTDPPYGEKYELSNKFTHHPNLGLDVSNKSWGGIRGDETTAVAMQTIPLALQHLTDNGSAYVFCGKNLLVALCNWLDQNKIHYPPFIVWDKGFPVITWHRYHLEHEMIVWCGPGSRPGGNAYWFGDKYETSVWRIPIDAQGPSRLHPTQKPVALVERAMRNSSQNNDNVGDPFLGSGTTLIAAERLGRTCYGMEQEPKWVDVAVKRWEQYAGRRAHRNAP